MVSELRLSCRRLPLLPPKPEASSIFPVAFLCFAPCADWVACVDQATRAVRAADAACTGLLAAPRAIRASCAGFVSFASNPAPGPLVVDHRRWPLLDNTHWSSPALEHQRPSCSSYARASSPAVFAPGPLVAWELLAGDLLCLPCSSASPTVVGLFFCQDNWRLGVATFGEF